METIDAECDLPTEKCCGTIEEFVCDADAKECIDSSTRRYCNSERTAWITAACPSGSTCQDGTCVFPPTPTPASSYTCVPNGGQCMTVSACSDVYMQTISGTCSGTAKCCKTIEEFACNAGAQECVNNTTRRYCNSERTAWITAACPSGSTCQDGTCVFPCQGTCYSNSSCSAIGKYSAVGECSSSNAVCCQDAPSTCQGSCYTGSSCSALGRATAAGTCPGTGTVCCQSQTTPTCEGTCYTNSSCGAIGKVAASGSCLYSTSVCCKEASTATCEGTCYTNSSCGAIGKVDASGTCLYSSSVCCKDATLAQAGSLALGESCKDDSECASGNCNTFARYEASGPTVYYPSPVCLHSLEDQAVMYETSAAVGGAAALVAISMIPGVGPVVQITSALIQGGQAIYTCSQLAQVNANPEIDSATKTSFKNACITSSISAVTGAIGGGASAVSTFATGLSTGTQLALTGVSMVDNVGNVVVSGMNANNACNLYGSNSFQCYAALGNAGVAVGSIVLSGYQFGQSYGSYSQQRQLISHQASILETLPDEYVERLDGLPQLGNWDHRDNLPITLSSQDWGDYVTVYRGVKDPFNPQTDIQSADLFRKSWILNENLNQDQISASVARIQSNTNLDLDAVGFRHKQHPAGSPFLGVTTDLDAALVFAGQQGQVIEAKIPTNQLYNLDAMHKNIAGNQFGGMPNGEQELGVWGYLDPDWIIDVVNVANTP